MNLRSAMRFGVLLLSAIAVLAAKAWSIEMSPDIQKRREFAEPLVREAGALAAEYFRKREALTIEAKGLQNFVSEADRHVEQFIYQRLNDAFPADSILGEETGLHGDSEGQLTWVIDPIDGTGNFIKGIPLYCVLLALVKDGQPILGFTFDPERNEMYVAVAGQGATLNSIPLKPISESGQLPTNQSVIVVGSCRRHENIQECMDHRINLLATGCEYRRIGCAGLTLAWLAAGRVQGYQEYSLNSWDVMPGFLLNSEVGNKMLPIHDSFLHNGGKILVANPDLFTVLETIFP